MLGDRAWLYRVIGVSGCWQASLHNLKRREVFKAGFSKNAFLHTGIAVYFNVEHASLNCGLPRES